MEYTVQKLGKLAGVSTRTLRYYDEIGLLSPARINSSGYRIYGERELDRLQQILFYRELDVSLDIINQLLSNPEFDPAAALQDHKKKLLAKRQQIDLLIENVEKTLAASGGKKTMTDKEKFDGFKQNLIDENEEKYGEEIRSKYGNEQIDRSNQKIKNMTQKEYETIENLRKEIDDTLKKAFETGDPANHLAQKAADLHRQWLTFYWDSYSKEAHAGIAQMYVDDERFTAYYDKEIPGTAKFLRDAILIYTSQSQEDHGGTK